jgi:hypothetical protein
VQNSFNVADSKERPAQGKLYHHASDRDTGQAETDNSGACGERSDRAYLYLAQSNEAAISYNRRI